DPLAGPGVADDSDPVPVARGGQGASAVGAVPGRRDDDLVQGTLLEHAGGHLAPGLWCAAFALRAVVPDRLTQPVVGRQERPAPAGVLDVPQGGQSVVPLQQYQPAVRTERNPAEGDADPERPGERGPGEGVPQADLVVADRQEPPTVRRQGPPGRGV